MRLFKILILICLLYGCRNKISSIKPIIVNKNSTEYRSDSTQQSKLTNESVVKYNKGPWADYFKFKDSTIIINGIKLNWDQGSWGYFRTPEIYNDSTFNKYSYYYPGILVHDKKININETSNPHYKFIHHKVFFISNSKVIKTLNIQKLNPWTSKFGNKLIDNGPYPHDLSDNYNHYKILNGKYNEKYAFKYSVNYGVHVQRISGHVNISYQNWVIV